MEHGHKPTRIGLVDRSCYPFLLMLHQVIIQDTGEVKDTMCVPSSPTQQDRDSRAYD